MYSDDKIVENIKKGNKEKKRKSEGYLYDKYKNYCFIISIKHGLNNKEAEEVYNETIMSVIENIENGKYIQREGKPLKKYVARIHINKCRDEAKKKIKRGYIEKLDFSQSEWILPPIKIEWNSISENENRRIVDHCFNKLSEQCQYILTQLNTLGRDYSDIAAELGRSVGSLRTLVCRCLRTFSECLDRNDFYYKDLG